MLPAPSHHTMMTGFLDGGALGVLDKGLDEIQYVLIHCFLNLILINFIFPLEALSKCLS